MRILEGNILIVDDDPDILGTARMFLKQHGFTVQTEQKPSNIPALLSKTIFDVILLDMNFSRGENNGKEGLYWLQQILQTDTHAIVILITAYGEVDLAVQAIKLGATDFVLKPWNNEKLLATLLSALQLRASKLEVEKLRNTQQKLSADIQQQYGELIGSSPAMQEVYSLIEKVAPTDANVLILGENGTGKELVARALHTRSLRSKEVFISVDLGAISETLFESELFGHVKGAFTDAREDKPGRFELASGGTIFLDEIGNLSPNLQAKLLTVLQSRKVRRLGSVHEKNINIRLICATNMPLHEMVQENTFRQDLLYRINTVEIRVPALRERKEDIPSLLTHFMQVYTRKYKKPPIRLEPSVLSRLKKYEWPGNIRELQHAVERAVILSEHPVISSAELFLQKQSLPAKNAGRTLSLEEVERNYLKELIEKNEGNISKVAKELGMTRPALYRRINKYGL
ncbi:sigma-54-dependent Fis family transcriptional regulator [Rhodocytophaga rosea]|uniref:Sigma-54-dependent Fis family transcriptional regulator n=1 Tax=Rhodocytophaga rosea TaxID=2704465 RepID=A0A6C0GT58_9BACT|nr:sigma-54 dependent transcriptional regulator [Rhodocytophaga rosea]QHT71345.1 sigma-54-dependent Fis family transcriptional regulator [Rhodocytophaga rosea]